MIEEKSEPLGIGDSVGVKCSEQRVGGVGEGGVARGGETLVLLVANDAYRVFCGDFGGIICGTVVNDQQLVRRAGLIEDGGNGVWKISGAVEAGDVGGDFWRRSHWWGKKNAAS